MRKLFLIPLLFAALAHAQTPLNAVLIGPEGITITACSTTNCTYLFGAGTKLNTVSNLRLPALISCANATSSACVALGPAGCSTTNTCDPAYGVAKSIYAVQQATAYTVTWKNTAGVLQPPTTVPALPPPPLPTVTTVATYKITGGATLTIKSDGSFTLSGTGITVSKQ